MPEMKKKKWPVHHPILQGGRVKMPNQQFYQNQALQNGQKYQSELRKTKQTKQEELDLRSKRIKQLEKEN